MAKPNNKPNSCKRSHLDVASSSSSPNQPNAKKSKHNARDAIGTYTKSQSHSDSVIVFDFDDTLFPTSKYQEIMARESGVWVPDLSHQLQSKMVPSEYRALVDLSLMTFNLLSSYIKRYSYDNIYIVSASSNGWIKTALQNVQRIGHFKQIHDLLFDGDQKPKLTMIHPTVDVSNQKSCKNVTECPCYKWKFKEFKEIFQNQYFESVATRCFHNFVFIGDSNYEYLAAKQLKNECDRDINHSMNMTVFIHRIKLVKEPTFTLLKNQQILLEKLCKGQYFVRYSRAHDDALDIDYKLEMESWKC